MAAVLAPMLDSGTVTSVTGMITDPSRSAAEGVWAVGGGIELPCEYDFMVRHKNDPKPFVMHTFL